MNSDVQGYLLAALGALVNPAQRHDAFQYLMAHARDALPLLLAALDGPDESLAVSAAQVLSALDDRDCLAASLTALGRQALYGSPAVSIAATVALATLPASRAAVLTLEEVLRNEQAPARVEAALGLARLAAQGEHPLHGRAAAALGSLYPSDVGAAVAASLTRLEPAPRSALIPVAFSLEPASTLDALRDGLAHRSTAADAAEVLAEPGTMRAICAQLAPATAAQAAPALAVGAKMLVARGESDAEAVLAAETTIGALLGVLYALHDPLARAPLLAALEAFGDLGRRLLAERLGDEEPARVAALAQVLAEVGWHPGADRAAARYWIARGRWDDVLVSGADAIGPLVEAFLGSRGERRRAAAQALERLNWTPTEDRLLVPYLVSRERWRALGSLGERAVPRLADELAAERQEALAGSAQRGGESVRAHLVDLLSSANPVSAAPALSDTLENDPAAAVRSAALHALQSHGKADAALLARALRAETRQGEEASGGPREPSAALRTEIVRAIGSAGGREAVDLLTRELLEEADPEARSTSAAALATLYGHQPDDVLAAASALIDQGEGAALGPLLARIDGPLVGRLAAQLGDGSPARVSQAVAALVACGRFGGAVDVPLRMVLLEGSAEGRLAAARVYDRLDAAPSEPDAQAAYWLAKGRIDRCVSLGAVAVPVLAGAIPRYEWRMAAAMAVALLRMRPTPEPPAIEELVQRLGMVAALPSQVAAPAPPLAGAEAGSRPAPVLVSHDEERSAARAFLNAIADLRRPSRR